MKEFEAQRTRLSAALACSTLILILSACSPDNSRSDAETGGVSAAGDAVLDLQDCVDCPETEGQLVFDWAAGEPGLRQTNHVRQEPAGNGVRLRTVTETKNSGGHTTGAFFTLDEATEAQAAGKTIRVQAEVTGTPGQSLAIAYSTADVGNSGWKELQLSGERQWVGFEYAVPEMVDGNNDYLGLQPAINEEVILHSIRITSPETMTYEGD